MVLSSTVQQYSERVSGRLALKREWFLEFKTFSMRKCWDMMFILVYNLATSKYGRREEQVNTMNNTSIQKPIRINAAKP